jgi:hypothetical protein
MRALAELLADGKPHRWPDGVSVMTASAPIIPATASNRIRDLISMGYVERQGAAPRGRYSPDKDQRTITLVKPWDEAPPERASVDTIMAKLDAIEAFLREWRAE